MPHRTLFADTFYWIALIFPRDTHHAAVLSFSRMLRGVRLETTDEVPGEFLSYFAGFAGTRCDLSTCVVIRGDGQFSD